MAQDISEPLKTFHESSVPDIFDLTSFFPSGMSSVCNSPFILFAARLIIFFRRKEKHCATNRHALREYRFLHIVKVILLDMR